ncbi:MAG: MBL fold metallo-hydrolase [Oscillospiraceae bacterium]|nr:MBL fold metallo-hydrolase [Oscillospiraceae bacterium]
MELIWNGHSCFTVKTKDGTVVLDPFEDGKVPGYKPLRLEADLVLCSHEHADHNARKCVTLSGKPCRVAVETVASWHDDVQGAKRGPNTIHILGAEGMRIAHLGDLGCALDEAQAEALKGLDALLIPVGGFYTISAERAYEIVQQLQPRVVIPMHYRDATYGYDVLSTKEDYRRLCSDAVDYDTNRLTLTADTLAQTAFLHQP